MIQARTTTPLFHRILPAHQTRTKIRIRILPLHQVRRRSNPANLVLAPVMMILARAAAKSNLANPHPSNHPAPNLALLTIRTKKKEPLLQLSSDSYFLLNFLHHLLEFSFSEGFLIFIYQCR